jgi:hypothetical protein
VCDTVGIAALRDLDGVSDRVLHRAERLGRTPVRLVREHACELALEGVLALEDEVRVALHAGAVDAVGDGGDPGGDGRFGRLGVGEEPVCCGVLLRGEVESLAVLDVHPGSVGLRAVLFR